MRPLFIVAILVVSASYGPLFASAETGAPDLTVYPENFSGTDPQAIGNRIRISTEVRNVGDGNATGFTTRFTLDGSMNLGEARVGGLGPWQSASVQSNQWNVTTPGNHTVSVNVDILNEVSESNEGNNSRSKSFPAGYADFRVISITPTVTSPRAGDSVSFRTRIQNSEPYNALGVSVRWYIDGASFDSVERNFPANGTFEATSRPWVAIEGSHTIRVALDSPEQFPEVNETNNDRNQLLPVGPPRRPDLVVLETGVAPGSPVGGSSANFYARVKNVGEAGAATSTLRFQLDGAAHSDAAAPPLAVGATANVTSASWTTTHGAHTIRAIADANAQVVESNESNNDASQSFFVLQPNLVAGPLTGNPISPLTGDSTTFNVTVANAGDSSASAFDVHFAIDGTTLGTVRISSLAPGASIDVASPAWNATAGNHTVIATVDSAGELAESNESDNGATLTVTVRDPIRGVDLTPASQSANVLPGGSKVYSITVRNTGERSDTIDLARSSPPSGWTATLSATSVSLAAGASATITLTVTAPVAGTVTTAAVQVTGTSRANATATDAAATATTIGV